ncbi:low temperature requirement protein A [Phytohabitans rumicis]|uniref:Low temperature requirement protein A n=1 Tax=Phytohabitans rumicis TaxID=1076125 RepID=A0A6V8KVQ9_9ACTN|nr:low temperature requirement protein A [Phytohabitans rumicis]GFJ87924.1 low temperature requirement protein A [Phytohabitans rumicis]
MSKTRQERDIERGVRVSTLELFFDLVFVFTLTQLTALLADELTVRGAIQITLMLGIVLWMYDGFAWLTNAIAPTSRLVRTLILIAMGGLLAIALSIPDAFGDAGWVFGLGYFVVNAVHTGLFIHAGGPGAAQAMLRLAPVNLTSATLVLVGGFLPGNWRYAAWALALLLDGVAPYVRPIGGFTISPAHFVERHGLLVIIALGESVVAIGVGAAGLELDLALVTVAALGLTLSYFMWWVYFGDGEAPAERALSAVPRERRALVAVRAYGYAHALLLLGIVVAAAGVKKVMGHAGDELKLAEAIALAGGLTLYLLGDVAFRLALGLGRLRFRIAGALVALATIPLGMVVAAGQLVALIVVLFVMFVVEAVAFGLDLRGRMPV